MWNAFEAILRVKSVALNDFIKKGEWQQLFLYLRKLVKEQKVKPEKSKGK